MSSPFGSGPSLGSMLPSFSTGWLDRNTFGSGFMALSSGSLYLGRNRHSLLESFNYGLQRYCLPHHLFYDPQKFIGQKPTIGGLFANLEKYIPSFANSPFSSKNFSANGIPLNFNSGPAPSAELLPVKNLPFSQPAASFSDPSSSLSSDGPDDADTTVRTAVRPEGLAPSAPQRTIPAKVQALIEKFKDQLDVHIENHGGTEYVLISPNDVSRPKDLIKALKELMRGASDEERRLIVEIGDKRFSSDAAIQSEGASDLSKLKEKDISELVRYDDRPGMPERGPITIGGQSFKMSDKFSVNDTGEHYYVDADREQGEKAISQLTGNGNMEEGWVYVEYQDRDGSFHRRWFEIGTDEKKDEVLLTDAVVAELKRSGATVFAKTVYHHHPKMDGTDFFAPPTRTERDGSRGGDVGMAGTFAGSSGSDCRVITGEGVYTINKNSPRDPYYLKYFNGNEAALPVRAAVPADPGGTDVDGGAAAGDAAGAAVTGTGAGVASDVRPASATDPSRPASRTGISADVARNASRLAAQSADLAAIASGDDHLDDFEAQIEKRCPNVEVEITRNGGTVLVKLNSRDGKKLSPKESKLLLDQIRILATKTFNVMLSINGAHISTARTSLNSSEITKVREAIASFGGTPT